MENVISGNAYVLGDNIDTDQIIPAKHLVYNLDDPKERKMYGAYALSGVPVEKAGLPGGSIPFIGERAEQSRYSIIVAGKNFGCGSSREHAPVALQVAGVRVVIAQSYARIFYRNAVDGGYLIPYECEDVLVEYIRTGERVEIDCRENRLVNLNSGESFTLNPLGVVEKIIVAGGIFEYARINLIKKNKDFTNHTIC